MINRLLFFGFLVFSVPLMVFGQNNKVQFIKNNGQWESHINFKAEMPGGTVWLEGNQMTFDFVNQDDLKKFHDLKYQTEESSLPAGKAGSEAIKIHHHTYRVKMVGAKNMPALAGVDVLKTYHNYYLGSDPTKWASKVPLYNKVLTKEVYPNIDLLTYSENGNFKYDFIVHAKGEPLNIRLKYEGSDSIGLYFNELLIRLSVGDVYEHAPIAYQRINGQIVSLECSYLIDQNEISVHFPNGYDKNYELIIDPELIFSTYSGSVADNWGFTATYGLNGTLFGGGIVFGAGYPITVGAWESTFSGGEVDIGITKYTADGTNLIYSTYLGGNDSDVPHSLIIDNSGNLVVMGSTGSTDFPVGQNAYSQTFNGGDTIKWNGIDYLNGSDIFITKFSNDGTALLGSTYMGGSTNDGLNLNSALQNNYGDQARGDVFIDEEDRIYVVSSTSSNDFPTTPDSEEQTFQGLQDGVVFSLSSDLSELNWSTYIGGSGYDAAYSIKVKEGVTQLAGGTTSLDFPTTSGSFHPDYLGGSADGFVILLDTLGSVTAGTYIGTNFYDQVYFLDDDSEGNIFVIGQTGGIYPRSSNVYSNTNGKQFIHSLSPDLSKGLYSTKFGSISDDGDISLSAFLVDSCDHIYASGWGGGLPGQTGNTFGLPITSDAYQSTTDGTDFYFIVFTKNMEELLYATFFGGAGVREHVDGGTSRFDKNGVIYQAVCAGCGGSDDFPTTPGAWSNVNGSFNCNLGTIKMEFDLRDIEAIANVNDSVFCNDPPYQIPFYGSGEQIPYHEWDFGDGSTSNEPDPVHPYNSVGTYSIRYVVVDSNRCDITDTTYTEVTVGKNVSFSAGWITSEPQLCEDTLFVEMAFTGTGADSLIWDMDDGTFYYDSIISHTYFVPGIYDVTLTALDIDCDLFEVLSRTYILDGGIEHGRIDVPNIFTPNGDGINDEFHVFYPDIPGSNPLLTMDYYNMLIYDRWGREVFKSTDDINGWEWDGTANGSTAPEAVYFYIVEYDSFCEEGGVQRITGYVTLLR